MMTGSAYSILLLILQSWVTPGKSQTGPQQKREGQHIDLRLERAALGLDSEGIRSLSHNELLNHLMEVEIERAMKQAGLLPGQDPLLMQLMRAVQDELDKNNLSPPAYRQNPLLRQLATQTRSKTKEHQVMETLTPPKQRQDPLLRQLRTDVMDAFIKQFLQLPGQKQDTLLKSLQPATPGRDSVDNLNPPEYVQDPLLRQLSSDSVDDQFNFLVAPSSETFNFQSLLSQLDSNIESTVFGKTEPLTKTITNGIDFSEAKVGEDGSLCVIKEDTIETIDNEPVLECIHKTEEKCHLTYVTYFKSDKEEKCDETFEKSCHISFRKQAKKDNITTCRQPIVKVCNGQGAEDCKTEFETSCTTKYIEASPGRYVGDTSCDKIPVEICGNGCSIEEGPEECQFKQIDSLTDIPEEFCDIIPQKSCHHVTRLVPGLRPTEECSQVPREICSLKLGNQKVVTKPLRTEWCLDQELEL